MPDREVVLDQRPAGGLAPPCLLLGRHRRVCRLLCVAARRDFYLG
ncbi:hypothetical protein ACFV03_30590 [Streptomyces mirabilis]